MSARLKSETNEDNEPQRRGNRPAIPPSLVLFPIAHFGIQPFLISQILMAFTRLPRSISPFPSESPTPPLSGISVLPPTVAPLPNPEEPEPAGNSSLDMSLVRGRHGKTKRVGWFIWDARKGCVPYLFLIIRLAHRLAEKIIPWIHCATNDPPSLCFTPFPFPSTYPTYDALFGYSSNTSNQIP